MSGKNFWGRIEAFLKRTAFWTTDYFHKKPVHRYYDDMKNVLSSYEKGKVIQEQHLKEMLAYATRYSPFYQSYRGKPLSNFPVVNKNILIENYDQVAIPVNKIPGQNGELFIQRTSGSTGRPFAIPQDTGKRNRRVGEIKYFNETAGFRSHEKLGQCRVWTSWHHKNTKQEFRENIYAIQVKHMDDATISELVKTVKKRNLVALRAYASYYEAIAHYFKDGKGNLSDMKSLRVCFSTSESLSEYAKDTWQELWGIPIVETYANEEAGMMGQQQVDSNAFYLNHSGYVFEFLKLDEDKPAPYGELSRIVITDLFNHAFLLIRYDTGDTAICEKGNVESNGWDYISKLYGRRMDLVYDIHDNPIHPMNFSRILKNLPGIIQYQFVQKGQYEYVIRLNMENEENVDEVVAQIKEILGGAEANVQVEMVDEIPVLASGKRKPIVNEWKKS